MKGFLRFLGLVVSVGVSVLFVSCANETLQCAECRTIQVTKVIDGDTFDSSEGEVRLYGAKAQARGEPCFQLATNELIELAGSVVRVEAGPESHGPDGRRLFYVYTESGDSIDEVLVKEGWVEASTRGCQHRAHLKELEGKARIALVGCIWRNRVSNYR